MGWLFVNKDARMSAKDYFIKEFSSESENGKLTVLDISMRGSTSYMAIERINKRTGERIVFAVVCLTSQRSREYYNFGYKDIEEDMGPCYYDCPERILRKLTVARSEYALKWRESCRAARAKKPAKLFNVGDVLVFKQPLFFGNIGKFDTFKVTSLKPLRFWAVGLGACRFRKSTLAREYKVVPAGARAEKLFSNAKRQLAKRIAA
ncbi:MAG: hypothetical protein PHS46_08020 [Candidatus Omnitrophica bacterium]|nr:hypothetical protein [Candidatus Omnitrophota bacterium]